MDALREIPAASNFGRDLWFQQVFDAAAIGISLCQVNGHILEANLALGRMLGYDHEELAGLDPWKLDGKELHSDNSAAADSGSNGRLLGELIRGERDSFAIDKLCRRKDGSEFWGHVTVSLARGAHGEPAFLVVVLGDASERKRVEESLHQAEKMEVIGRLAGGIAHDFNNLLTGILLYCDLMLSETAGPRLRHHLEEVRMASEHGSALTQQLLAIARKQTTELQSISINEIVSSTENLLRRLIGERIELATILDPSAGMVFADPAKLRQIVLNLVLNARDAMERKGEMPAGKIQLRTRRAEFPRRLEPGDSQPAVALAVEDNGSGMNAATRARLFEPFFTTKKDGTGTGMGLATVHRIVHELGGEIEVASESGMGTRIEVFLPALGPIRSVSGIDAANVQVADSRLCAVQRCEAPESEVARGQVSRQPSPEGSLSEGQVSEHRLSEDQVAERQVPEHQVRKEAVTERQGDPIC